MRVFHDRLINATDRRWFTEMIIKMLIYYFRKTVTHEEIFEGPPILFADFVRGDFDMEDRRYEEFLSLEDVSRRVNEFLIDYNTGPRHKLDFVFFRDALEHLTRVCRILRQPLGNAMLIGVGGCGK